MKTKSTNKASLLTRALLRLGVALQPGVRRLWWRVYSTEEVLEIDEHGKVSNPRLAHRLFGKPLRDSNGTY